MIYKQLGSSDLKVPVVCLGTSECWLPPRCSAPAACAALPLLLPPPPAPPECSMRPRTTRPLPPPHTNTTVTFGQQNSEEESFEIMDYALSRGCNWFDTAEL
jgi:hypothetical protein